MAGTIATKMETSPRADQWGTVAEIVAFRAGWLDAKDSPIVPKLVVLSWEMSVNRVAIVTGGGSGIGHATALALAGAGWQVIVAGRRRETLDEVCAASPARILQSPRGGRIINNGSISAHVPRPNSVPYTVSKHAITGLTRALALEGRGLDIACGQIDIGNAATEMTAGIAAGSLQADGRRSAEPTMNVEHVAATVVHMASLPLDANVLFLTIMATKMPFVGRG
jgi:NAD(P)-dependent dehydrogenase (short-subunit alcohol dehydrogenase family)